MSLCSSLNEDRATKDKPASSRDNEKNNPQKSGEHRNGKERINSAKSKRTDVRKLMRHLSHSPTLGHLLGLQRLFGSAVPCKKLPLKRHVTTISTVLELILKEEFIKGVKVSVFGSFLTELFLYTDNCYDLNLYIDLAGDYSNCPLGTLLERIYDVLETAEIPFISEKIVKRYDWVVPSVCFFAKFSNAVFSVTCSTGPTAHNAYLSSKLVYVYLTIYEPMRGLALFVRYWAKLLKLNVVSYGGVSNYMFDLMVIHYLQRTGFLPILHEALSDDQIISITDLCSMPVAEMVNYSRHIVARYYGKRLPFLCTGELIYGFFRYYAAEFDEGNHVCQVVSSLDVEKKKKLKKPFVVVEDPFTQRNIAHFRQEIFSYFSHSITVTAYYICSPRTPSGPILPLSFTVKLCMLKELVSTQPGKKKTWSVPISVLLLECADEDDRLFTDWEYFSRIVKENETFVYNYVFSVQNLTPYPEGPPLCCHCCGKSHREPACPLLRCFLPQSTQKLSAELLLKMSAEIQRVYSTNVLTRDRMSVIIEFVSDIEKKLQSELELPSLTLRLFGSLTNGFGSKTCDLDICMVHGDDESLMDQVATLLDDEGFVVETVLNAKVPIVKFSGKSGNHFFSGDISISNILAIHNSELLSTYAKFDERVPQLGIAIKLWARNFGINDARNGTVSSYAYIVMLLHYLQNCDPPVLPFLQEIAEKTGATMHLLDGYDITFTKDVYLLKTKFHNTESVGELFYGFFFYYANVVDFDTDVIQIRRKAKMSKVDKDWCGYKICVEDPFELDRNLTGGMKIQNFAHFIKCLKYTLNAIRRMDTKNALETFSLDILSNYVPDKIVGAKPTVAKFGGKPRASFTNQFRPS